jgi:glycosyltransferase involved in cell wall biosynthesis
MNGRERGELVVEPLISILIPAFNAEQWIGDTIRSALAQSWRKTEIIVVDDGSRDRTLAIAQEFASKQVLVIAQENAGAAAARNRALSMSQGDFIQWLDADDLLAPDKIQKQVDALKILEGKRWLLSSAWGSFLFRTHRAKFKPTALWQNLPPLEWLLLQMEQNLHMQTATWLVSRELTEAAGPWDIRLGACASDDGEYFCRVILRSEGVRFVPESKVYYRVPASSNQSYVGLSNKKLESQLLGLRLYIEQVCSWQNSARTRAACVKFLQSWVHLFYPNRMDLMEQVQNLARTLGGELGLPRLSWKYAWIQKFFGVMTAKRVQLYYNKSKLSLLRFLDKALLYLEHETAASAR